MLNALDLTYERDEHFLFQNLTFEVKEGSALQISGMNGSGKTTLLKIITGMINATAGNVKWNNHSIYSHRSEYYENLLYIGHLNSIHLKLTPKENLIYQLKALSQNPSDEDIQRALAMLGLYKNMNTICQNLSAGQQRRTALAKLILSTNKLWILDEPLTSLDQDGINVIENILKQHLAKNGMLIITSHQPLSWGNIIPQDIFLQ